VPCGNVRELSLTLLFDEATRKIRSGDGKVVKPLTTDSVVPRLGLIVGMRDDPLLQRGDSPSMAIVRSMELCDVYTRAINMSALWA
jgi:hypothetical protein